MCISLLLALFARHANVIGEIRFITPLEKCQNNWTYISLQCNFFGSQPREMNATLMCLHWALQIPWRLVGIELGSASQLSTQRAQFFVLAHGSYSDSEQVSSASEQARDNFRVFLAFNFWSGCFQRTHCFHFGGCQAVVHWECLHKNESLLHENRSLFAGSIGILFTKIKLELLADEQIQLQKVTRFYKRQV